MKMVKNQLNEKGITLLELILVLSLLTIAVGAIFNFYFLVQKNWNKADADSAALNEVRSFLSGFEKEVRSASSITLDSNSLEIQLSVDGKDKTVQYRARSGSLEKSSQLQNSSSNFKTIIQNISPLTDPDNNPLPYFERKGKNIYVKFYVNPNNTSTKPIIVNEVFTLRNKGV
ncbi:hypothetical protein [Thermosyntropha sp.]|uniref:hypothetical protein n=1 Tax=Thermosyntropha sp. TaxID=2740820 RepID=UPI0025ECC854|nr:hypothetical protein [Thermosyntropha sp.]MBO8159244.1 hypothetical protein [Thermosyntropha sp.]